MNGTLNIFRSNGLAAVGRNKATRPSPDTKRVGNTLASLNPNERVENRGQRSLAADAFAECSSQTCCTNKAS